MGYALDAGASIIVPQVETVEEARHVVSSAKYGTKQNGTRSAPPFRLLQGLTDTPYDPNRDLHKCLNDQAAVIIQIESLKGIQNLAAILSEVPDIDAVWLGTLDARISMNLGDDPENSPEWLAAEQLFKDTLKKHNKPWAGFSLGGPEALAKNSEDMAMCFISCDILQLGAMAMQLYEARQVF